MKDIYKSKKQLIKELEDARQLLSQKATKAQEADSAVMEANQHRAVTVDWSNREALYLIREAIDSATDAIGLSDTEGRHLYHNKAFSNLFEYTIEELAVVGNEATFAVKSIAHEVFTAIMSGGSWIGEVEMRSKSGRIFNIFLRADAIKDDEGKIVGLVGVYTDISERKRLEYQLRKKHDELQLILDSIPAYVFYKDKDGKMLNINKTAMSLAYAPKEKLLQKTVFDLVPNAADKYNRDDMEVIRSGQPKTNIEESLELPSGIKWLKTDKLPIKDDEGNTVGLLGFSVDITEHKRADEALRESEVKMRSFFEVSPDVIMNIDRQGKILFINRATTRPIEETIGTPVFDYIPPDYHAAYAEKIERVFRTGRPDAIEIRGLGPGKRMSWYEARFVALDSGRKERTLMVAATDITGRKRAEEALRESEIKYRYLAEKMTDIVWTLDMDLNSTYVSPSITRILGYTPEERLLQPVKDQLTPESYELAVKSLAFELERDGTEGVDPDRSVVIEVEYCHKDGSTVWMENVVSAIRDEKGKPVMLHGVSRDITERRKAEEASRNSEEKLRMMFSSMADGVVVTDLEGKITDLNEAQLRIFGYKDKSELIGKGGFDFIALRERGRALADMFKVYENGLNTGATYVVVDRNGREFECELSTALLHDAAGKPSGTITVMRDVTERRRMEHTLRESEERYRLLAENSLDAIWTIDMSLKYTFISPAILRIVKGYALEELQQMSIQELLTPESFSTAVKVIEEELALERTSRIDPYRSRIVELALRNKDGSAVWTEVTASFTRDSEGKVIGVQGSTRDITERRKTEQLIRESEERYRLLAENVSDVIWTMDLNLNFTYISPSVLSVRGYTADEAVKMPLKETVTPDSMSTVMQVLKEEFEVDHTDQYTSRTIEVELKCKNGSTVWTEMKLSWLHDTGGKRIGIMGVTRDITERKKTGEALRETSEKLRVVFDSIGEAVTVVDINGDIVDANKEALRLHGFKSKEEIVGKRSTDMVAPIDRERAVDDAIKSLKSPYPTERKEYKLIDTSGREFDGEFNVAVIRDSKSNPSGFIGVARDISERKIMEKALKRSEEFFKEITENASDVIVITDKDGVIKYCSRSIERFAGYKPEELIGKSAFMFIHPDDVQRAASDFGKAVLSKDAMPNAFRIIHKDGTERYFDGLGKNLLDNPSIAGFIMNVRDVTERRKVEETLRDSEEKLRVTFDSMMDGIVISDANINIVDVNKAVLEILGVKNKEELLGRSAMDVIRFKNQEQALTNLARMFQELRPQERVEYGIVLPGGKDLDIEVSTAMMHNSAGNVVGFVNAIRDISERKQVEEALRKSEEKYRHLVEREKDVIVSVDALGFVKSVNSAVTMWGYTQDEVLRMNFIELIAPEWREVTAMDMQTRLLESGEYVGETMVVRKNGEQRPIEYSAVVIEQDGKYVGAQAIVRDISERKKAEETLQARERYFRAISDQSSGAALVVSLDGNITDVTGGLERISGHTREATIGRSAIEFIHPEDLEKAGLAFAESLRNPGHTVAFEARLKNANGEWQWTESLITNLLDHPDVHGIVNHLVDITTRKKAEEEIRLHAQRIEALYSVAQVISQAPTLEAMLKDSLAKVCDAMDTESGCIFMLDLDENSLKLKSYVGVEESIREQFSTIELTEEGIEKIMQLQGPVTEIDEAHTVADVEKARQATTEIGRKAIAATPLFRGDDLHGFLVVFSSRERRFSSGDLELFKAIASEISIGINNLMLLEKTKEMSVTDELTGLYNRRYFFEMLDVEVNRSERTKHPFSLVMLDLDGFKEYNDKYGHSNGDAVLETFSRALKAAVRKSDLAFRYGGDEFALILPSADAEKARKIVQRARARWEKIPLRQTGTFGSHVGFSGGIAEYPANAESPDGLLFLADAALYQAKKKGYEDKIVSELRTLSADSIDVATQDQVYALAATVDARDPYTYGHSQRVADTALRIGQAIGMPTEDLTKLHAAALLHDIGKVGVPDSILTKPGKPTSEEWDVVRKHCAEGARILGYVKELTALVPIVLHHHEWYNGSGYPSGLRGLDIPSGARITSVADAYDTMVTKRPYRDPITPKEACEELKRNAGTQFDPVIVDVWTKMVESEGKPGR